jgi:hypothetical protein
VRGSELGGQRIGAGHAGKSSTSAALAGVLQTR